MYYAEARKDFRKTSDGKELVHIMWTSQERVQFLRNEFELSWAKFLFIMILKDLDLLIDNLILMENLINASCLYDYGLANNKYE